MTDGGPVRFGVLGARSMVANAAVMPAIDATEHAEVVAVASLGGPVPSARARCGVQDYEAVLADPAVEAVYIPLPNDRHRLWTERAAAAGKHVLCEKPLAATADDARAMYAACNDAGVLLAEAWMTPFDRRWAHARSLVDGGMIGALTRIDTAFTFTIGEDGAHNYRWEPAHGGGALLDVGIYCLGPAVEAWGAAPVQIAAHRQLAASGVDASTTATLTWTGGRTAHVTCSFVDDEQQRIEYHGASGTLLLDGDAHTGGLHARTIVHRLLDGTTTTIDVVPDDPYRSMIDAFSMAVRSESAWPRSETQTIDMIELLEQIAEVAG